MQTGELSNILKPRPRKYRNLVRHLSEYVFTGDSDESSLSQEDIFQDLSSSRGTSRFLGYYSKRGVWRRFELFGIFDRLSRLGLNNPELDIDTTDPFLHKMSLHHNIQGKRLLSGELHVRKAPITLPDTDRTRVDCLVIEWFLLQNPLKPFSRRRPQLPGQDHPGLGIAMILFEMFYWIARRFSLDGVLFVPNYLHTGVLYGRQCAFINPEQQALLQELGHLLEKKSLDQLSWACAEGKLVNRNTNEVLVWTPMPMVLPVSRKMKDWFYNADYSRQVRESREKIDLMIFPEYKKEYSKTWMAE